ncbi:MAG: type II CRISPR RNA-guided endonuclease Cas9 [Salinivirgaceae bacterium]|nr:type II CRISPR RNA-guided endonuclease Cas9 [Salinivirgaceae bacterium]
MKKILGLDLGTNSIGWALINHDFEEKTGEIFGLGSRIIPMSQDVLGKFDSGISISQTAERTGYRGVRRLYQRDNLRRERLHRVLNLLEFLPEHYSKEIDFEKRYGQFIKEKEPKISIRKNSEGKNEFLFMNSFLEMSTEFKQNGHLQNIPYDWVLYFLRKKALKDKITKEELAWLILNFNQKRGYYQLRGEEDVDKNKQKDFCVLKVKDVIDSGEEVKGKKLYDIVFENDWKYDRQTTKPEDWLNKTREFIVTASITKSGETKRTFKAVDSEIDWIAIKTKTEHDIENANKTVGEFIYEALLDNPSQKIRGKLVRTIERKFYKNELEQILEKQCEYHDELKSETLYQACLDELYPRNEAHQNNIKGKGFKYLFLNDIIFYQRPLKSKKSSIACCTYETRTFKKTIEEKVKGSVTQVEKLITEGIKAIPKSNPLFQEFRLWQFISNLRIYKKDVRDDTDVTGELLPDENDWVDLFDFLFERKEVEQKNILDYFARKNLIAKTDKENYRWNYVEDKKYPCNETHTQFLSRLKKVKGIEPDVFFTPAVEIKLWHIIYSVKDKHEYEKALKTFASKYNCDEDSFVNNFIKFPPFENDYGAYSQKAINKLLPIMRMGKYWNFENIHKETVERIEKLLTGEFDENISVRVREKVMNLRSIEDFRGLPLWLVGYIVYNRHSESGDNIKWSTPNDIDKYLIDFKQHSLRNPIVEQVVTETLRTVRDIWEHYGNGGVDFFNEIHVELGREMKNPANKRQDISRKNIERENTNQRIRELLEELMNDNNTQGDIRPHSPSHQEILKLYEEGIYQNPDANYEKVSADDIEKIRKNNSPSNSDIKRYKLWLEQGYRSPYTGDIIPLSKLFTTAYQIEHIIPQARYFDDSLSNKIICESEVNQLKSSKTAYEFLKDERGRKVELSGGKIVTLFSVDAYEEHCNKYFKKNRQKLTKLMSEDIPEGFIERQMNDSRYISKLVKSLLSNIVRAEDEQELTSKNIIPVTGVITSKLKQDWGLNEKWNEIVAPRFIRLNEITNTTIFGTWDKSISAFRSTVPDELKRNFNKKRIDHRHHAMDALIIACANRKHIQYLNALNENYALRESLLVKSSKGDFTKTFLMPWNPFPIDAMNILQKTIVSFKQNLRVINKTNNKTWQWVERSGLLKKELVKQTKGDNWAIRKPMHKETVSGSVAVRIKKEVSFINGVKDWKNIVGKELKNKIKQLVNGGLNEKEILKHFKDKPYEVNGKKVLKVELYTYTKEATAVRTLLSEKFTRKQLENITDSGIQKILEKHVSSYADENGKEKFDEAFSPEGIETLNANIVELNGGKFHHPIFKVRIYEEGSKFNVGYTGNKHSKYVEAAKGTNLFFAVYWNMEKQKREFETIPLNVVIEHQKQVAYLPIEERTSVPVNQKKGKLLFVLSPNDLVYIPTNEEAENINQIDFAKLTKEQTERIFKMVSTTGGECHFIPNATSTEIVKNENGTNSKSERIQIFNSNNGIYDNNGKPEMIKVKCWKLELDRLGNITKIIN